MSSTPQPLLLDTRGRRLFAVLHATLEPPRAGVLICPPILHEHSRSYRLFALLGDALATQGVAVLRFDYFGTGDSAGADNAFSLADASVDAAVALNALRDRIEAVPITVLGVRAGAFPALSLAQTQNICALWLWQPIADGAAYLEELRVLDCARAEMDDIPTYPECESTARGETTLVGFPCSAKFLSELEHARIRRSPGTVAPVTVLDLEDHAPPIDGAAHIHLASVHGNWVGEVDIGHFLAPPVLELGALLVTLTRPSPS